MLVIHIYIVGLSPPLCHVNAICNIPLMFQCSLMRSPDVPLVQPLVLAARYVPVAAGFETIQNLAVRGYRRRKSSRDLREAQREVYDNLNKMFISDLLHGFWRRKSFGHAGGCMVLLCRRRLLLGLFTHCAEAFSASGSKRFSKVLGQSLV